MEKPGDSNVTTAADLFAAAPRGYQDIPVGAATLRAFEVSIFDRMKYQEFVRANKGDSDLCMAELVRLACPVLRDQTADEIREKLKPEVLLAVFMSCQVLAGLDTGGEEEEEKKD